MWNADTNQMAAAILKGDAVEVFSERIERAVVAEIGSAETAAVEQAVATLQGLGATTRDVALETADAALLRSRVTDVPRLIRLSRAAMGNIRQNIAVPLGLKAPTTVVTKKNARAAQRRRPYRAPRRCRRPSRCRPWRRPGPARR